MYQRRIWPVRVVLCALLIMSGVFGFCATSNGDEAVTYTEIPSGPTPPLPPSHGQGAKLAVVKNAQPIEIYVPHNDPKLRLHTQVIAMPDNPDTGVPCKAGIDPPTEGEQIGAIYWCSDFAPVGSESPSLAVLAGHSSNYVETAMNKLYRQGVDMANREIWIRNGASGDHWLVYKVRADGVSTPLKTKLPYMTEIWGAPGESTANRLALITCLQVEKGTRSTRNYVLVADFVEIR